jgi:hypothetical protein
LSTFLPLFQNANFSLPIVYIWAMIFCYHRVQYIQINRIQPVQYIPSTASMQNWLSSFHYQDYEMTTGCGFSCWLGLPKHWLSPASFPHVLNGKLYWSHCHSYDLTNQWIKSQEQ